MVLSLAACAGDNGDDDSSGDGVNGAAEQDTVVLYSGRNEELIQPLIDQFTESTDIEVEVRYGGTAEMAAQLIEEGENTSADIFLAQDAGALGSVAQEGMFETLDSDILDRVSEIYRDDEDGWVGLSGRLRTLVYNTEDVDEAELPDAVADLTEPEFEGRVGVAPTNASFQAFVTAYRELEGDDAAAEFLSDLAANDPQIRERNGDIISDVADGVIDMGLVNHYYLYALAKEQGVDPGELSIANHLFGDGDVGALMNVTGAGILNPDNDAAVEFLTYLLSEDGQGYFVEETAEYALIDGFDAPEGLPALDDLDIPDIDLNSLEDLETTVQMITDSRLVG